MTNRETKYSEPWVGQDNREHREVAYWIGDGWRTFLQVKVDGKWCGW